LHSRLNRHPVKRIVNEFANREGSNGVFGKKPTRLRVGKNPKRLTWGDAVPNLRETFKTMRGFTLLELLIVIAIIAILAALLLLAFHPSLGIRYPLPEWKEAIVYFAVLAGPATVGKSGLQMSVKTRIKSLSYRFERWT
jgi:prepilin-type N-terminal cleavage/methylation domain-containing protein